MNNEHYDRVTRIKRLKKLHEEKRKQPGVEFPKAGDQKQLLIVRLDLTSFTSPNISSFQSTRNLSSVSSKDALRQRVQKGLQRLCKLFQDIDLGKRKIGKLNKDGSLVTLTEFDFSATLGFGSGFFDKLSIPESLRPRKLKSMPDHVGLGDIVPYSLQQTDLIIQLGSTSNVVNNWVYENAIQSPEIVFDNNMLGLSAGWNKNSSQPSEPSESPDIVSAIAGWATVTDLHAGFQRMDGRNLMGFNDGVSDPNPGSGDKFDEVVWNTENDEGTILKDGT